MSPASFARAFRRRFGTTVTGYIGRIRLARVAHALVTSDAAIAAIAMDAGFGNLSHFNRSFRRAMGLTPRAFRRRHGIGTE